MLMFSFYILMCCQITGTQRTDASYLRWSFSSALQSLLLLNSSCICLCIQTAHWISFLTRMFRYDELHNLVSLSIQPSLPHCFFVSSLQPRYICNKPFVCSAFGFLGVTLACRLRAFAWWLILDVSVHVRMYVLMACVGFEEVCAWAAARVCEFICCV